VGTTAGCSTLLVGRETRGGKKEVAKREEGGGPGCERKHPRREKGQNRKPKTVGGKPAGEGREVLKNKQKAHRGH